MRWTAPPDRREIALILFSLSVFLVSYNLDNSIRLFGLDPEATHGIVLSKIGLGSSKAIGNDGRRLPGYRDALENEIFGAWRWDGDEVGGDGAERSQLEVAGRHDAMWLGREETGVLGGKVFGETTVNDGFLRWQEDIPQSKLLRHVPGYTILDNVFIFKGTVYIVSDDFDSFPHLPLIVAAIGPGTNTWEIISTEEARDTLGQYGAILRGVTWMSADTTPHNSTLLSLWRTYSSLDPNIDGSGRTSLPPPHRLFFPQVRVFTDPDPLPHFYWIPRRRVDTGFHPYLLKAAFPSLTVMYLEDWEDYHKLELPFLIERIVVADREAAETSMDKNEPALSSAFRLDASQHWWEPVRQTLVSYFGEGDNKSAKKVVTYLHRQGEETGVKLHDEDHQALLQALTKIGKKHGYEVHVVSSRTDETVWSEKLSAVAKSTVVIGVHGTELVDSAFMKSSPQATLVEFFPVDTFTREQEVVAHSRGVRYIAWWYDR
ncbi:hypothetical protein BDZ94DRAFT_1229680 [Collybia nuda]|uniref:Glycosyltransferase n=1 Tax=Collybia nuda TaxID=64659 RepID=A0A9P6CBU4_9AGAR|nr:hypothetical protein BDZ94DRAFT_1229680 [Collybia nuda]